MVIIIRIKVQQQKWETFIIIVIITTTTAKATTAAETDIGKIVIKIKEVKILL